MYQAGHSEFSVQSGTRSAADTHPVKDFGVGKDYKSQMAAVVDGADLV